jgi:3-oxoacyl-[acyl-carrier-protein] synthase III
VSRKYEVKADDIVDQLKLSQQCINSQTNIRARHADAAKNELQFNVGAVKT